MNIGFDAKRAFYNRSGLGNYSRSTLQQLVEFYPENNYLLYTPSLRKRIILPFEEKVTIVSPGPYVPAVLSSLWRTFGIAGNIRRARLHLFHGLSNELPAGIERTGVPSVVTIHDLIFLRYPKLYPVADVLIYRRKFSQACRYANAIIAVSRQTKEDIVHYFSIDESKIHVVYQSCDPRFGKPVPEEEKLRVRNKYHLPGEFILCVGTIEERKNQLRILEALHRKNIQVPLVLAGKEKPYALRLRKYIAANHLKNVIFLGELDTADLPALYQNALIFVYPSLFEGFGIPILEALFSGIPVITSEGGCFQEAGGPGSVYIKPDDTGSRAEAMDMLLKSPARREQMKLTGWNHAADFMPEKVAANLMNVYQMTAV